MSWDYREDRGYMLAVCSGDDIYLPNALHVERIDELMMYDGDFEAAKAAEQDGIQLIYGMKYVPNGIYLDTPENRTVIQQALKDYPYYKDVVQTYGLSDTPRVPEETQTPEMGLHFGGR